MTWPRFAAAVTALALIAAACGSTGEGDSAAPASPSTTDDTGSQTTSTAEPAAPTTTEAPVESMADQLAAAGVGLSEASGEYILATPTDGDGNNERSGIWWTVVPRAQSLFLPELPEEWVYEGWLIVDGTPLTTGTFRDPFASDDAAPYSGPEPAPPLVGEDLIVNAPVGMTFPLDLRGQETAITVEPADDPDSAPSDLVVLAGTIPAEAVDHTAYPVENVAAS